MNNKNIIKNNEIFNGELKTFFLLIIIGGIGLYIGWKTFWFLTDDAYIAFRYVSNSILGYGYVWNPPPFLPVEGYTSFLWIVILEFIWRIIGLTPPQISNLLLFVFSYLTLIISAIMIMRINLYNSLKKKRIILVALLLIYLLLNRTFLTWASSGLETALFNLLLISWIYNLLYTSNFKYRIGLGSLLVALITLTRPDGLLFCISMLFIIFVEILKNHKKDIIYIITYGTLPLGIVFTHQIWRLAFYGEWLPNTYYAKVISAWPKSGILYAISFILEYSLWFAFIIIFWALILFLLRKKFFIIQLREQMVWTDILKYFLITYGTKFLIIASLVAHLAYYTFIVGGDHFEYRVYSYIIPLVFIAIVWSLNQLEKNSVNFIGLITVFILLSLPVQWTHWALTKNLNTREETHIMHIPISKTWPTPFQFYAELFDEIQKWLITHFVCMRHQEHKIFWKSQINLYPTREESNKISSEGFPIYISNVVGVPAWVLPNVNIIDHLGLNDYTIARTPIDETKFRRMAHSRLPPKGYIKSYRPNILIKNRKIYILKRNPPLTEKYIKNVEFYWREKAKALEF